MKQMDFMVFRASKNDDGRRLDKIIRIFATELSLSEVYKYIRKGLVKVNGKKAENGTRIFDGDEIQIADFIIAGAGKTERYSQPPRKESQFETDLKIVFENEHILIIDKPYDLPVHGSELSIEKKVLEYYKNTRNDLSLSFKSGPLHRLDRKTTGLLCFSMSLEGAKWFSQNIKNHTVQKKYAAILQGKISKTLVLKNQIKKEDSENGAKFHTVSVKEGGESSCGFKDAVTIVTPVATGNFKGMDVTLSDIEIKTGRTHQIRAQTGLAGHPLLGDGSYGGKALKKEEFDFSVYDFFLEAYCLNFPENPVGLPPEVKIPLCEAFSKMIGLCFKAPIKDF